MSTTSVIDKMRARAHEGTPCLSCGTPAVACQVTFLESDQRVWCCSTCREAGAHQAHRPAQIDGVEA